MMQIAKDPVVRFRTVGLSLTMQCNFLCEHCITESTPDMTETIEREKAFELIEDISRESESVCFTGGESLLREELLLECMEKANEKGLTISLVSNGFWAVNDDAARKKLKKLCDAGLDGICISLDRFHLPYVSKENALRAARICKEFNLKQVIRVCTIEDDGFPAELKNETKDTDIKLQIVRALRLGRAQHIPLMSFNLLKEYPDGCCTTVLSPVILPSGLVQSCCGPGTHFGERNPLNTGNWKSERLRDILRRSRTSPFVMALHNIGPKGILDLLYKYGYSDILQKRDYYTGICELCIDICNNPDIVSAMESLFNKDEIKSQLIAGQVYQQSFSYLKKNGFLDLPGNTEGEAVS